MEPAVVRCLVLYLIDEPNPVVSTSGVVDEHEDGEATHGSDVWVYGFDGSIVVVALDRTPTP